MVNVRLLVEGGGESKALRIECRRGFHDFLSKAGRAGRMPRIVACGGRQQAYDDFRAHLAHARSGETTLLLVDSEAPVADGSPWDHLRNRAGNGWARPAGASDDHCHLMVQCMEAWFLADRDALRDFYEQGFLENALPGNTSVESVPKQDVLDSLQQATQHCKTKSPYSKGDHSFALLSRIDSLKVLQASPWAKRLVDTLKRVC